MIKNQVKKLINFVGNNIGIDIGYFLKNGLWVGTGQIITMLASLGLSIVFARLTTKEFYGQYQLILAIMATVSVFSIQGLNTSILQATAKGFDGNYKKIVKVRFLWSLLGVPLLLLIGSYFYIYQDTILGIVIMVTSAFFPFFYAFNTWNSFMQGKERFDLSVKYSVISEIISIAVTVIFVLIFGNNLLVIISIYFVGKIIINLLLTKKSFRLISNQNENPDVQKYGWFLTKIQFLGILLGQFDKLITGIFLGPAYLAIYSIGANFSRKFLDFTKSLLAVASPRIAKKNTVDLKRYIKIFVITSIIALCLFFLIPILIPLFFSEKYNNSIFISQIIILFLPFFVISLLFENHFIFNLKNKNILAIKTIFMPIIMVLLMIPALYFFNILGLAFLKGFRSIINIIFLYILNLIYNKKPQN